MQGQGWESGEPIRVLVADDDAGFRGQLRATLDHDAEITVVSEAADGKQAVELVTDPAPDVVLLDVRMPVLSGPEAAGRVRQTSPVPRSSCSPRATRKRTSTPPSPPGANGYLLKDASLHEVTGAVNVAIVVLVMILLLIIGFVILYFWALNQIRFG